MRSEAFSSRPWIRITLCVATLTALGACSSKKDKVIDPPAELTDFPASLRVQRVWDAGLGGDGEKMRLGLGVTVVDGRAFAAGRDGDVEAFDVQTGKSLWHTKTKAPLSGGTGAGEGLVVVGSSEGAVIALNAADGAERWHVKVNGEVLSAPAISANIVVVRTVDGKLRGLASDTGKEAWQYEQQVPRLSLRGAATPIIVGSAVICGFDNGKVVALSLGDGALLWENTVAPSHGRTELERLVDIDSAVKVNGNNVYAVGFQGRVAMIMLDSGQTWWAQDSSSYRGLEVDDQNVYISTAEGEVVALNRANGTEVWRQKALAHRGLSAPALTDNAVAVADFQGFVHWLDKGTGALAGRAQAGGERISNPPVAIGDRLLVINDEGKLTEFKAAPISLAQAPARKPQEAAPSVAPAEPTSEAAPVVPPSEATPPLSETAPSTTPEMSKPLEAPADTPPAGTEPSTPPDPK